MLLSSVSFLVVLILGSPRVQAQGGIPLWTNRYHGPTNSYSVARAVAVDRDGNVLVTGHLAIGNGSDFDYVTIKYSNAGAPLWTNRYGGPGDGWDTPGCIAVDSNGDVIVTGGSDQTGYDSSHTNLDYATIKYSNAGVPLWTNRYNGPGNSSDGPGAIAVDSAGNVVVTGASIGNGTGYDYATIKYSGAGVPLWTNRYNGIGNDGDGPAAIAVDASGNVFVTGSSAGGLSAYDYDYVTIKYSSAGMPLWTNRYDGPAGLQDWPTDIAVDSSGNVIVTGTATRDDYFEGTTYYDYTTIKYSNAGGVFWVRHFTHASYDNAYARAMAVDSNGNVCVTGMVDDPHSGTSEMATVAYSTSGVPLWTNLFTGPYPRDIAVDSSGNVFVTGYSTGTDTNLSTDAATIAYSTAGVWLWTSFYIGPAGSWDEANAVAVDGNGNVFVAGSSGASAPTSDFVTIKYSSVSPPAPSLTIGRTTTNTVVISWPSPSTGFVLQQNTNALGSINWSNVSGTIQDNGTNRYIIVNPSAGNRFYRLLKP